MRSISKDQPKGKIQAQSLGNGKLWLDREGTEREMERTQAGSDCAGAKLRSLNTGYSTWEPLKVFKRGERITAEP